VPGVGDRVLFVAARHLCSFDVTVNLLGRSRGDRHKETKRNWEILERLGYDLRMIMDSSDQSLEKCDLILDVTLKVQ
jgi:NAD(P)H-hydrate repair Nnr-like enzyme with NAD(P)H-hydrate epimerase domain